MKTRWRFGVSAALALALAGGALPAGAHDPEDNPSGGSDASIASHAGVRHSNMELVASSPNSTGATNSDLAFWKDRAYAGNYNGFRIFDISDPASPDMLSDFSCPGPQNDLVVWKNELLITTVDRTMAGPECGSAFAAHDDPNGWEGLRLFDVSDPAAPVQIGSVYLDCGAHTATLAGKYKDNLVVWVSSYPLRPGPTCGPVNGPAAGRDPLHGVIQVVSIPLDDPASATEIAEPPIVYPGDPDNMFKPSEHGLAGPGLIDGMRACHDITVLTKADLAAAACAEQSQLWRIDKNGIPDTANPVWTFDMPQIDFHHSATFTWDGKVVNVIDESFKTGCPTAAGSGRMYFLDAGTGALLSQYMIPRTESDPSAYCSAHLGNVVPTNKGYYLVNAWYTGGVNVIDFTDPTNPVEIAYWDRDPEGVNGSDNWSAYWYEGPGASLKGKVLTLYATEGVHAPAGHNGLEVFSADIPGLKIDDKTLNHLNPQTQEKLFK